MAQDDYIFNYCDALVLAMKIKPKNFDYKIKAKNGFV